MRAQRRVGRVQSRVQLNLDARSSTLRAPSSRERSACSLCVCTDPPSLTFSTSYRLELRPMRYVVDAYSRAYSRCVRKWLR